MDIDTTVADNQAGSSMSPALRPQYKVTIEGSGFSASINVDVALAESVVESAYSAWQSERHRTRLFMADLNLARSVQESFFRTAHTVERETTEDMNKLAKAAGCPPRHGEQKPARDGKRKGGKKQ